MEYKTKLETQLLNNEITNEEKKHSLKNMNDIQKQHKLEMQKMAEELAKIRDKWHSPQVYNKIMDDIDKFKREIKYLKDEIKRKQDALEIIKQDKDEKNRRNEELY